MVAPFFCSPEPVTCTCALLKKINAMPFCLMFRPCGCGSGDSGCAVCGICRSCAGEYEVDAIGGESANSHPLVEILARNAADVLPPFDVFLGSY